MNIAHLLPAGAVFPLRKHNGRYEWVLRLARQQVVDGHTVTIYAGEGSSDDSPIIWRSIEKLSDKLATNNALIQQALREKSHDVFHSHFDFLHYRHGDLTDAPIIVTQHWFPTESFAREVVNNHTHNVVAVPVTQLMKRTNHELGIPSANVIYHGIDLSLFRPGNDASTTNQRLLFVGRIHPGKGVDRAIQYAIKAGIGLDIVGKVNETEQEYWQGLQSAIDGQAIRYLGPKSQSEVAVMCQQAKALIFPNRHEEAFGQVIVEAQACGAPVIASATGATSELIRDGETGFLCKTDEDFVQSITEVDHIDRHTCRLHAQQFDFRAMVAAYTALYHKAIESIDSVLVQ